MTAEERRVTKPLANSEPGRPPMPREHGAWGILLIPFATAIGVTGVFDLKVALLLGSVLCFYIARTSYLKGKLQWMGILIGLSFGCAVPLLFFWQLWWLVLFGVIAAPLAFRKTERSVVMQLLAVGGLTLTAPAAWYAATGALDARAWWLWLLNALYFASGVFYVKMHIAAAIRRQPFESLVDRAQYGAAVLAYHAGLVVVLLALASGGVISFRVLLAYAPMVARAFIGVVRLKAVLRIKRLGWTEVAYSIVFAALLMATMR
jgi:hypothetical protein